MKDFSELAESKLVIIYLLHKMSLPISLSYVQEFALDSEYMDYFSLSNYLMELSDSGYIRKNIENNKTTYSISEKGYKVLTLFDNLIPNYIKEKIDEYVRLNKIQVKKDLEIISSYEQIGENEFTVKCCAYENNSQIIEINLKVASKKYARTICENWKKDASKYYISFVKSLLEKNEEDK